MKKFKRTFYILSFLIAGCLAACVTINIYFPAEKVESMAADIVDDIIGLPDDSENRESSSSVIGIMVADIFFSKAYAAEETKVSNPAIRTIKQRIKDRRASLKPFYAQGIFNELGNGYLEIKEPNDLSIKDKRDLKVLVDTENKDRKALYEAVAAELNIDKSQTGKVAEIFAERWSKAK